MPRKKVIVAGSANMDMVMRVQRLPKPGETLMSDSFTTAHGGKGANQAVAAARLGGQVSFIGAVGADAFGQMQRDGLAREGIDLSRLKIDPDLPTGVAQILIADTGDNMIVVAPSANHALLTEDIVAAHGLFQHSDVIITQLEIPLATVESALRMAREHQVFSILDTGGAALDAPAALIALADMVSPNETEAEALTGIVVDSPEAARTAAAHLRDMGVEHVVMKLGARGCLYFGEEELYVPAFHVDALDATAAGDAFTAALGLAWNHMPVQDALQFANAAGALATMGVGAQPSMPTLASVARFMTDQGRHIALSGLSEPCA